MSFLRVLRVAIAGLIVAAPHPAFAHGLLRSSTPASGAALQASPREILLTFTEKPEETFTRVRLFGAGGEVVLPAFEMLPGNTVRTRIPVSLVPGAYRIEWQTAGDDGHPVSGRFGFTVVVAPAELSADQADSASAAMGGVDTAMHSASGHAPGMASTGDPDPFASFAAILRWLTLVGAIAMIGTVAFRYTVLARVSLEVDREIKTDYLPAAARKAAAVGVIASLTLLATGAARLLLQSLAMHGSENIFATAVLGPMVTQTNWGMAWAIQLLGALVAFGSFLFIRRGRERAWTFAIVGCLAVSAGLALASHSAVVPRLSSLSMVANGVHTIAAAGWLGNLLLIFSVGLPLAWRLGRDDRWTVVRDIVNAFSPAALAFGALAGATGIFMAWTHVGSIGALTGTDYGKVLLLKVALLSLTAVTGAYNWLRVRPGLGDHAGARQLRATAGIELGIATIVLAVTAVLVALPLPDR